jgi:hypothetical protein
MSSNQLKNEIHRLLHLFLAKDIAVFINPVTVIYSDVERVTWLQHSFVRGELFRDEFCTIKNFRDWVSASAYSAILFDGSILQLSYDFKGGSICAHRLSYLPCPYDIDQDLLRSEPLLDLLDVYNNNMASIKLRTPLRFEYDADGATTDHAATHLTMLWSHCRWPVSHPMSVGHFIKFIFQHFYPELWKEFDFIRSWPDEKRSKTIIPAEELFLHVTVP